MTRARVLLVLGIACAVGGAALFVLHGYPRWSTAPQQHWGATDYLSWLASPLLWLIALLLWSNAWAARATAPARW